MNGVALCLVVVLPQAHLQAHFQALHHQVLPQVDQAALLQVQEVVHQVHHLVQVVLLVLHQVPQAALQVLHLVLVHHLGVN